MLKLNSRLALDVRFGSFASMLDVRVNVRLGDNLGNAGCLVFRRLYATP
jgi:hypothetical protein